MRLMLGDYGITIAMKDTFGKRPGLYIENRNCSLKVGNFASEEKAKIFDGYLKHLVGLDGPYELWKGYDDEQIDRR